MIKSLAWTLILTGFGATACAEEAMYRYSKPLELPQLAEEELLAAPLDSDVYAATRDGLPDLRIRAAKGDAAYLLRKATETKSETTRSYWSGREPAVRPLDDGNLEITLHLGKDDEQPTGVRIVTPLQNFQQRVRVEGSTDGKNWHPLGEEAVIFDYSQYMDVRNDEVPLPANSDRYFRIVVDDVTQQLESQLMDLTRRLRGGQEAYRDEHIVVQRRPFRINYIDFWRETVYSHQTGDLKVKYPLADFRQENDDKSQQSTIYVTSRREPLTSLALVTDSHNFSRQAAVEIEDTQGSKTFWRPIGSANLSRLDFRSLQRESLTILFPETRAAKYRIVIDNRGSPPLEVTGITAEGNQYEAVFLAPVPQQSYELLYGNATALAPDYDTAAITASLDADYQPVAVTLGKQIEIPGGGAPAATTFKDLVNNPWLLGGAAIVLVAALGWGLFRAGRRLDNLSHDKG